MYICMFVCACICMYAYLISGRKTKKNTFLAACTNFTKCCGWSFFFMCCAHFRYCFFLSAFHSPLFFVFMPNHWHTTWNMKCLRFAYKFISAGLRMLIAARADIDCFAASVANFPASHTHGHIHADTQQPRHIFSVLELAFSENYAAHLSCGSVGLAGTHTALPCVFLISWEMPLIT